VPLARAGADLVVQAKSGTGKTAVFGIAAVELARLDLPAPQVPAAAPPRPRAPPLAARPAPPRPPLPGRPRAPSDALAALRRPIMAVHACTTALLWIQGSLARARGHFCASRRRCVPPHAAAGRS